MHTWTNTMKSVGEDALSSQVLRDDLEIIQKSAEEEKKIIMEPARNMVPEFLPSVVSNTYNKFAEKFVPNNPDGMRV